MDYALRILRTVSRDALTPTMELCKTEQIPQPFAYKIIKKLSHAGYVRVLRGSEGGCILTADLGKKTLRSLMDAMGADFRVNACMTPGYTCTWQDGHGKACSLHGRLNAVQQAVETELERYTLAYLLFGT